MEDGGSPNTSCERNRVGNPGPSLQLSTYVNGCSYCLLRPLDGVAAPLASNLGVSSTHGLIRLNSDKVHTIGRCVTTNCDVGFGGIAPRFVSRRHCQIFLDSSSGKLLLMDGFSLQSPSILVEVGMSNAVEKQQDLGSRPSATGTYVNGQKLSRGSVIELSVGDEVSFGCQRTVEHDHNVRYGFSVVKFGFFGVAPRRDSGKLLSVKNKRICKTGLHSRLDHGGVLTKAISLLKLCRSILESANPINYIRDGLELSNALKISPLRDDVVEIVKGMDSKEKCRTFVTSSEGIFQHCNTYCDQHLAGGTTGMAEKSNSEGFLLPSDGKLLFLNCLEFMDATTSNHCNVVSLRELFHPVESLKQVFIASFTSDVPWFLSYCGLPFHLPITIACHNAEKCWTASADKRTSMPYADYPNLVLIHPPFPDSIAFGKERKNRGIGCHHPKFFVLQREDAIRIIVTSANLVSRQWHMITNTVWWQDFPRRSVPDYISFFTRISSINRNEDLNSDFAAQLAGFMSSLVIDIPEQSHWITELAKYNYGGAAGHLIASIPGIHMDGFFHNAETEHSSTVTEVPSSWSSGAKLLGSVQTSVVGISHLFRTATDLKGIQLRAMALLLGNCHQNTCGMTKVTLRRITNIPTDSNAVGIFLSATCEFSNGDFAQLGFLPKEIAKWVSPLSDAGFFSFSACIFPKEAIAAAIGGTSTSVQLILYVSQGPKFSEISSSIQPGQLAALCSLLAHIQRCLGLWRLQEVLGRYRWPESLETDFVYGCSSIGTSVNPQFLAAFAAAAGKRSSELFESEESDPEWGRWTVDHELQKASIRIIFPTIERVKNGSGGVASSRFLLSLSEKTWQRLKNYKVFHDAIPHPADRTGHPMHVKVACRLFQSKTDTSPFGWLYCGSHNFSPAAWGHLIQYPTDANKFYPAVNYSLRQLRICNYELGVLFVAPQPGTCRNSDGLMLSLDPTGLPFVMPAPKYQPDDRAATTQAMREASLLERESVMASELVKEMMDEEILDEDEEITEMASDYINREKEEEKIYAEMLWSQVNSTECQ